MFSWTKICLGTWNVLYLFYVFPNIFLKVTFVFNNALFDIKIDSDFRYSLEIPFDNSKYVEIFKRKVVENGFDYLSVRIYEASLFLSMLPLHIDNPHKVFGFILNARNILEEIENDI